MPPGGSMHTRDILLYTNPEAFSGAQNVVSKPVHANLAGLASGHVHALWRHELRTW